MKNLQAIILLFIANSISGIAQGISMIAIPWYFAQREETRKYAIVYLLVNVISLFWGPLSGTFVDKYNRKYIFMVLSSVSGVLLVLVAGIGFQMGELPWYWVAFVLAFTFFNYNIHYPNLYAFVQEISEPKYYGKIASYIEIQGQLTSMLAGAGGALLLDGVTAGENTIGSFTFTIPFTISKWDIHEIFLLDASTYFLGLIFIYFIRFVPMRERKPEQGTVIDQIKTGLKYLNGHRNILIFGVATYSIFVTVLITTFFLFAIYVNNHLQESGGVFATAELMYALGAVLAGLAIRQVFSRVSTVAAIIFMIFVTSGLFFVLSVTTSIAIFFGMSLILGITNAGTRILRVNYLFHHLPNQVYGRANSVFFIANVAFRILFISIFYLAFFHESNHVIYAFAILSVFLLLSAAVLIANYRKFAR